jgi:hypothetical protein
MRSDVGQTRFGTGDRYNARIGPGLCGLRDLSYGGGLVLALPRILGAISLSALPHALGCLVHRP